MSKSKTAPIIVGSKKKDRGKKGRKIGKGVRKLAHSKWGNYAGLINRQTSRRLGTMGRRFCKVCETQFHSRGALKLHACK